MQNEIEIMHILRVPPMGKLVVSFNNQRYESISQVPDAKVQQLMLAAIGELITFAGGYQKLVDAGVAPPISPSQAVRTPVPPPAEESDEATSFVSRMEQERDEIKSAKAKPTISLLANLRPRPARNEASANKMLNLVAQGAVVILENFAATLQVVLDRVPIPHVVVAATGDLLGWVQVRMVNHVVRRVRKLVPHWELPAAVPFRMALAAGRDLPLRVDEPGPDAIAVLQYTGGTTGVSKAAVAAAPAPGGQRAAVRGLERAGDVAPGADVAARAAGGGVRAAAAPHLRVHLQPAARDAHGRLQHPDPDLQ